MNKADKDWQKQLTSDQYAVLRKKATEAPFSGELLYNKADGVYACAGCDTSLFSSSDKYDSGSGWPSFTDVVKSGTVKFVEDTSYGMHRTEVVCSTCGGHLGHVFNNGPAVPSRRQYCINSAALNFTNKPSKE